MLFLTTEEEEEEEEEEKRNPTYRLMLQYNKATEIKVFPSSSQDRCRKETDARPNSYIPRGVNALEHFAIATLHLRNRRRSTYVRAETKRKKKEEKKKERKKEKRGSDLIQ